MSTDNKPTVETPSRAQSGAPQPTSDLVLRLQEACALSLATAFVASLPAALRVSRAGGHLLGGWLAATAVLLLPTVLLFWSARAAGRGFRMLTGQQAGPSTAAGISLWLGLLAPGLVVFASVLKVATNHRGLGGATFGVFAILLAVGTALVARRLLGVGRKLVDRGVSPRVIAAAMAVLSIGPLFLVLWPLLREPQGEPHSALVASAVIDTVIVAVAGAVALVFDLKERPKQWAQRAGATAFVVTLLIGFGWLSASQPLGVALRQGGGLASALVRGLESWTDRDKDGVGAYFGGGDCDEGDPRRHPGAVDDSLDGVDQDCDGVDGPVVVREPSELAVGAPAADEPKLPELPKQPDLVVVTLDTVRADRTSAYGYEQATTPTLVELAKQGMLFKRAYATGSDTQRALMPFFSAKLLEDTPKDRREWPTLLDEADTVAERLGRVGYSTAAVASFQWLSKDRGFTQGFDTFHAAFDDAHPERGVTGPHAVRAARSALTTLLAGQKPFYLWLHLFDPHEEYRRHRGHDFERGSSGAYNSEIAFTDKQLADLLETLNQTERGKRAVVMVVGSHGEAFGEHAFRGHGLHLYDELTRVPLIIRAPFAAATEGSVGQSYEHPVSTADVPATVLALAGASVEGVAGRSLVGLLRGSPLEAAPAFSRADRRVSVVLGQLKLIRTERRGKPRYWLFDLDSDPSEKRDLSEQRGEDLAKLSTLLDTQFGAAKSEKKERE